MILGVNTAQNGSKTPEYYSFEGCYVPTTYHCIQTKMKKTRVWKKCQIDFRFCLPRRFSNFGYVFKLALKLHWLADTQRRYSCLYDALSFYRRLMTLQWRRVSTGYFLKKVVPSCSKCEITYRFSKTLENTYEGLQFSEVTGLQPATLPKIDPFKAMKQRFQRRIHQSLPHSFNLFNKCRRLVIFKQLDHSINWIHLNG